VLVEILSFYGLNLLISNHCFVPDTTAGTFKQYFVYLEYVLDTHNFCVLLLGDFSLHLFKGKLEMSPAISQYYNKLIHFFLPMFTRLISAKLFLQQWQLVGPCVFLISLIFLLSMLYMCLCPLILTTLLLSLKCRYLLENQIIHLMFLSESTHLVTIYCYTALLPPTIDLLSITRPLLTG
jgi:hypothetical protein